MRFAVSAQHCETAEFIARPLADCGRGDVADVVIVEAQHGAERRIADRLPSPPQAIAMPWSAFGAKRCGFFAARRPCLAPVSPLMPRSRPTPTPNKLQAGNSNRLHALMTRYRRLRQKTSVPIGLICSTSAEYGIEAASTIVFGEVNRYKDANVCIVPAATIRPQPATLHRRSLPGICQ